MIRLCDAMPVDAGTQFITVVAPASRIGGLELPYFLARFRSSLFSPEMFDQHGITFPSQIRKSVTKRQAEFIAGRICARRALQAFDRGNHVVSVGMNREPMWPENFIGSITHSNRYAAAVAYPALGFLGVGIDIETVVDDAARAALMEHAVSAREVAYLRSCASTDTLTFNQLLTLVFSIKESFFKAAFPHVKTYFDFDAVTVVAIDPTRQLVRFRCDKHLCIALPPGQEYNAHFELIDDTSILTTVLLRQNSP